jgi:hypothetical protein
VHGVALLVVALYVGVLWVPGLLLGRLTGLRGWTLAAGAPLLSYALAGLVGPLFAAAGIRWTPASAGLALVALALPPAGIRLLTQRRARGSAPEPVWPRSTNLRVAALLAAIVVFGAGVIWAGIGRLSAVPQDWDAAFHANGIRYIADTGDSSLVGMGSVNWFEDGVQVYYPNAYHLLAAIVLRLTGVDVPTVLNANTVLLPGIGALAIVALVHRFRGRALLAVAAAACATAVTSFYDMLWRGPLLPFTAGAVLMPLAVVLLLDLLDAHGRLARLRTGLLFAIGLVGLICLNPAVLFSAILFVLPAVVQRWVQHPVRLLREPLMIVAAGLGAAVLALPQLLGSLGSADGDPFDWPAEMSARRALFELVSLSHDGMLPEPPLVTTRPQWALTAAVLLGVIRIGALGRLRWILASGAIFGVLFLLAASSDEYWVNLLTRPWWNDRWRFIGLCVVPIGLLAGHGLAEAQRWLAGRIAAGRRPARQPAMLAAGLVGALFLAASGGLYAGQNISRMSLSAPDGPVVSGYEVEAMHVLGALVPPGQRVLNDRGDGSAWMYAIAGVLPVAGHYNASRTGPDARVLAERFNQYPTDPQVRAAVARLGAHYVMVDRGFVRDEFRRERGYRWLEQVPWLTEVYRNRDAVIYRIRAETPDRP